MPYFIFHTFFSFFGPHKKVWGCFIPSRIPNNWFLFGNNLSIYFAAKSWKINFLWIFRHFFTFSVDIKGYSGSFTLLRMQSLYFYFCIKSSINFAKEKLRKQFFINFLGIFCSFSVDVSGYRGSFTPLKNINYLVFLFSNNSNQFSSTKLKK